MSPENTTSKQPLIRFVNRQQMSWRAVDVDKLVGEDHPARAIWALVGRLDLRRFYEEIASSAEEGGRPAFDPRMLISVWVYACSEGIGSAREVAWRCEYDPAFQWLTGLQEVNYHRLADFRVDKQPDLDEFFTQVLAALSKERMDPVGTGDAGRNEDPGVSRRAEFSARGHDSRAPGAGAATCGRTGRSAKRRSQSGQEARPLARATGAATASGSGSGRTGTDPASGQGKHKRCPGAIHEAVRWRTGAQL